MPSDVRPEQSGHGESHPRDLFEAIEDALTLLPQARGKYFEELALLRDDEFVVSVRAGVESALAISDGEVPLASESTASHARTGFEQRTAKGLAAAGYTWEALLGEGAFKSVHRAHDSRGTQVAVKIMENSRRSAIARFRREARLLRDFRHPNVASIIDGLREVKEFDLTFFVEELVDGYSIRALPLRANGSLLTLRTADATEIVRQAAVGLAALHAAGLMHLDLSDGNVMIDRKGTVKLIDFGLTRPTDGGDRVTETAMATKKFASPEILAQKEPNSLSDIYSLGVLFCTLLGVEDLFLSDRKRPVEFDPSMGRFRPNLDAPLASFLGRMLADEPADRPGAKEVAERLEAYVAGANLIALVTGRQEGFRSDPETRPLERRAVNYCVGIDLGTTNTVCAVWEQHEVSPKIITIRQAGVDRDVASLKSAVCLRGKFALVGEGAVGQPQSFTSIKSHMDDDRALGHGVTASQLSSYILRAVKQELEARYANPPQRVVITVPAGFRTVERKHTLEAAAAAGFENSSERIELLDEPVAALLHQLYSAANLEPGRFLVFDMGGGTTDVTLVELASSEAGTWVADVRGTSRLNRMAGDDLDLTIAAYLLALVEETPGEPLDDDSPDVVTFFEELRTAGQKLKHEFSKYASPEDLESAAPYPLELFHCPGRFIRLEIKLIDIMRWLTHYFRYPKERVVEESLNGQTIWKPLWQCLKRAYSVEHPRGSPEPEELEELAKGITRVFVTGGSARFLPLRSQLARFCKDFGLLENETPGSGVPSPRLTLIEPCEYAIGLGAAWHCGTSSARRPRIEVIQRLYEGLYLETDKNRYE